MQDALRRIIHEGGRLEEVTCMSFGNDSKFITTLALRFESLTAIFRSVAADDTLEVSIRSLIPEPDEVVTNVTDIHPWVSCIGCSICWAWLLTNQQGYMDGARLEFRNSAKLSTVVVEMVVVASSIKLFSCDATS